MLYWAVTSDIHIHHTYRHEHLISTQDWDDQTPPPPHPPPLHPTTSSPIHARSLSAAVFHTLFYLSSRQPRHTHHTMLVAPAPPPPAPPPDPPLITTKTPCHHHKTRMHSPRVPAGRRSQGRVAGRHASSRLLRRSPCAFHSLDLRLRVQPGTGALEQTRGGWAPPTAAAAAARLCCC